MRLAIATASFGIHMVLFYAVATSTFSRGYVYFPEQEQARAERIDRFYLNDYPCICPSNLAERRRYSRTPVCLRSQCYERWRPSGEELLPV